ncbi:DUF2958 domain-containing protein [Methylobacterium sp. Leaf465]|uniref:DUF2958 domain-containing protein n=1 Tax=Methylobacterium sp. Leaf465 TaxID=1736385 RepID=UPI001FCD7732|nr:DUF2958 domain-containing protein [Methylobacterium sp. Leaf465]
MDPSPPLFDLCLGSPELGFVGLHELAALRGGLGLSAKRDRPFIIDHDRPPAVSPSRRDADSGLPS